MILSIATLTFLGSMLLNPGKTYRAQKPLDSVTVQVLNGSGIRGAAESLADALLPGDGFLMYDVIEKGDARIGAFERTLVVDRRGSLKSAGEFSEEAVKVARRLGINKDDVILLRLEDNILDIDVTIIAGTDYKNYVRRLINAKEVPL